MEAEAQEMLKHAAIMRRGSNPKETIIDIAYRLFGPLGGVELDLPPRG